MKARKRVRVSAEQLEMTRRQFMARSGGLGFSFATVSPVLYGLFKEKRAMAAGGATCPTLHIHAAGGGGFYQSIAARDEGGQYLSGTLLPTHAVPSNQLSIGGAGVNTSLGTPLYNNISGMNAALFAAFNKTEAVAAGALGKTKMIAIPNTSGNDNTTAAQYSMTGAMAMILQSQSIIPKVAHSVGLTNTASGNGTMGIVDFTRLARLTPSSKAEMLGVGTVNQTLSALGANTNQMEKMAAGLLAFMNARVPSGSSKSETEFSAIQKAASQDFMEKIVPAVGLDGTTADLDPARHTTVNALLGGLSAELMYTLIYNVIQGVYPIGALNMGGFDYHGNSFASTLARDAALGTVLGLAHSMAAIMGKPLLTLVTSDGAVRATGITGAQDPASMGSYWAGDDSSYVVSFMMYTAGGTITKAVTKTQIGHTSPDTGHSNTSTFTGTAPLASASVLANWCHLSGIPLSALDSVLTRANMAQGTINRIKDNAICFG